MTLHRDPSPRRCVDRETRITVVELTSAPNRTALLQGVGSLEWLPWCSLGWTGLFCPADRLLCHVRGRVLKVDTLLVIRDDSFHHDTHVPRKLVWIESHVPKEVCIEIFIRGC